MKAEFELNVDVNGNPCIKLKHYDKDNSIEQKLLCIFIKSVRENGAVLKHTGGFTATKKKESWDGYEIQIDCSKEVEKKYKKWEKLY